MEKQRSDLKILFRDGARPTGNDFGDFLDSFIHRTDDGFTINSNGSQINNFTLGTFTTGVPVAGSMRFTAGDVQFFNGIAWKSVSANTLGFSALGAQPAAALPDAAYFGKIGINLGAAPPVNLTDDFEVGLVVPATALTNKARVGEAVIGGEENGRAIFLNKELKLPTAVNGGDPKLNYALAQTKSGRVTINTVTNQSIRFCTNDLPQMDFKDGTLIVGKTSLLTPNPSPPASPPAADAVAPIVLHVHGHAIKLNGGSSWLVTSDERTKKDISQFTDGLQKLKTLRAVNFRYNGRGGTQNNQEQIGLIGQEVEQVFPYMVKRMGNSISPSDEIDFPEDMVVLDSSPLVYILMNAIREMDEKIEQLKNDNQHANA